MWHNGLTYVNCRKVSLFRLVVRTGPVSAMRSHRQFWHNTNRNRYLHVNIGTDIGIQIPTYVWYIPNTYSKYFIWKYLYSKINSVFLNSVKPFKRKCHPYCTLLPPQIANNLSNVSYSRVHILLNQTFKKCNWLNAWFRNRQDRR